MAVDHKILEKLLNNLKKALDKLEKVETCIDIAVHQKRPKPAVFAIFWFTNIWTSTTI